MYEDRSIATRCLGVLPVSAIVIVLRPVNASASPSFDRFPGQMLRLFKASLTFQSGREMGGTTAIRSVASMADAGRLGRWRCRRAHTIFASPMNTFNSVPPRAGWCRRRPAPGSDQRSAATRICDINATYPGIFETFSAPRRQSARKQCDDALQPGTNTPASVFGFGAVFPMSISRTPQAQIFQPGQCVSTFFVLTFNNDLVFGVTFTDAIGRVHHD
jgi:hypothetical protein